ncbi:MAG: hypothetical protein NW223_18040 [Hyphomicrobiaceae bacterium]|nr:hypothetical protein [Hyphomicrobiaceae bacterium]
MRWFHTKRTLRLSTRTDRAFLVNELVRILDRGLVGKSLHIMAAGRTDGAGAQAMAKISALALARTYGLTYVHTPFQVMEHAENGSPAAWAAAWESIFNLGEGELALEACPLPQVSIDQFIGNRSWWHTPCLLTAGHYNRFTDNHPEAFSLIAEDLRARYARGGLRELPRGEVVVCAHLRRGDVSRDNPDTAHRVASFTSFVNCLRQVRGALEQAGVDRVRIKVFSQGSASGLEALQALGCELHLDTPAIDSFRRLADADVLIMGRSSFSFAAALLCDGVRIYDPCDRAPASGWLVRNLQGFVDGAALAWAATGVAARFRAGAKGLSRTG